MDIAHIIIVIENLLLKIGVTPSLNSTGFGCGLRPLSPLSFLLKAKKSPQNQI